MNKQILYIKQKLVKNPSSQSVEELNSGPPNTNPSYGREGPPDYTGQAASNYLSSSLFRFRSRREQLKFSHNNHVNCYLSRMPEDCFLGQFVSS